LNEKKSNTDIFLNDSTEETMNDDDDDDEEEESPALPKRIVRAVELENLLCCCCCCYRERKARREREREREASAPRGRERWMAFWIFQKTNERTNGAKRKRKKDAGT